MDFKKAVTALQKNKEFQNWKKENSETYLSSIFYLNEQHEVKIAFYNPKTKRISTFQPSPYQQLPDDDVIENKVPKKLDFSKVKIPEGVAIADANKIREEKTGNEEIKQTIVILQNLNAQLYNITYVTSVFNILNIRINAETGKLIKEDLSNLIGSTKIL